ncbi:MAG TPA: HAMP domain-containing sensor histidine kinase [Candidatus Paceibacterota bacterium]|nr:HAMP domain-containing sensor histidine kinase [Verrucomicrobiota bacterium]HSA10794.1 HAMP domain-containing sensor histidine kinase [Candidatus Paceibacterota bacterium]
MNVGLWQRVRNYSFEELVLALLRLPGRAVELLKIPTPDAVKLIDRITTMERDLILPIKAAGIAMLLYSFYFRRSWIGEKELGTLEITVEATQYFLWIYIAANAVVAGLLLAMRRVPLLLVQWAVFAMSLADGIFLAALVVVTGGYDSILYWLFLGLVVRGAVSVPRATSQLLLNFTLTVCYVMAGVINIYINQSLEAEAQAWAAAQRMPSYQRSSNAPPGSPAFTRPPRQPRPALPGESGETALTEPRHYSTPRPSEGLDEAALEHLRLSSPSENQAQTLTLRLALLLLMTVCCYGVQVLLERQRRAVEEAHEFAMREGQLRSAGRVAAEFTHQMKNPLAIINNAAYSVRRALKQGKPISEEQIRIIQEEVEHSDRIITQIMGYAQLSEGHVEKLNVVEELDHAIAQVFPPAAGYPVRIRRNYAGEYPPLFMQRRHLVDTFMNLLQNAREALGAGGGTITVSAECHSDYSVEISIRDDGPGIPADKQEKIFEAYYTTKEKGTGLGLATIKHNVELYGGSVRVESALGKGAQFILIFPAKALIKLARQH